MLKNAFKNNLFFEMNSTAINKTINL